MTTSVSLQFKMKAMTNDVKTKPRFCMRIVERSTTTVRNKVASLSKREASMELVLFVASNHPISFRKMAATNYRRKLKQKGNKSSRSRQRTILTMFLLTNTHYAMVNTIVFIYFSRVSVDSHIYLYTFHIY